MSDNLWKDIGDWLILQVLANTIHLGCTSITLPILDSSFDYIVVKVEEENQEYTLSSELCGIDVANIGKEGMSHIGGILNSHDIELDGCIVRSGLHQCSIRPGVIWQFALGVAELSHAVAAIRHMSDSSDSTDDSTYNRYAVARRFPGRFGGDPMWELVREDMSTNPTFIRMEDAISHYRNAANRGGTDNTLLLKVVSAKVVTHVIAEGMNTADMDDEVEDSDEDNEEVNIPEESGTDSKSTTPAGCDCGTICDTKSESK